MSSFIVVCLVAVAALVLSEQRRLALGVWVSKPIASAAFVGVALERGALGSAWGTAILVALVLSFAGDVLLIPKAKLYFELGLGSFLLGHVAYGAAFVTDGVSPAWVGLALLPLVVLAILVGRWLLPHVPGPLRGPVVAYVVVITSMVALAAGHYAAHGRALPLVAALAFYLSDISVARDRFVAPGFINRAWGLPLYYAAQLLFALTI